MTSRIRSLVVAAMLPLSMACFQVDSTITLAEDLSGAVGFTVSMNMEELAVVMATVQKSFMGDDSPPTKEELKQARAELMAQLEGEDLQAENLEREIGSELPEGVQLLRVEQGFEGMEFNMDMAFAFDHVSQLSDITLEPGNQNSPGETSPFEGLTVLEEDGTLVIRNAPVNPMAESKASAGNMLNDALLSQMFRDLRVSFHIDAPFEIIEHNATSQDGSRLSWVYTFESFESSAVDSIFVRYRR